MAVQDGGWKHGGFWRLSDRSGFKYRNTDTVREWNGLIVGRDEYEPRQPQDFVRGLPDKQVVPNARPRPPTDTFIGPLVTELTAAGSPGDQNITVLSADRMIVGDQISVLLDNGTHRTTIQAIGSVSSITLVKKLPGGASIGNQVIDESAIAPANIG